MQQDRQGQQQPTDGMQAAYENIRRLVEQTGRAATVSVEQLRTERDRLRILCARHWISALAVKCYALGMEQAGLSCVMSLVEETLETLDVRQVADYNADESEVDDSGAATEEDNAADDQLVQSILLEQAVRLLK